LSSSLRRWSLAVAIVVAAACCFARLFWGLADGRWFHDESIWALRLDPRVPPAIVAVPEVSLVYPTLYEYAARLVHLAWGRPAATAEDTTLIGGALLGGPGDAQFTSAIAAARATSALAWMAGVLAIALAGRRFYGAGTGAVAALLLAVSPFAVMQVHSAAVDPLLATVGTCVLLAAWRLEREGTLAAALLAGVVAGLGFATKYTGLAFLCPVVWAAIEARRPRAGVIATVAAGVAGVVIGIAIGCPRCVARPDDVWHILSWHQKLATTAPFDGNRLAESLGWYGHPWIYQLVASLPYVLGLPVYLLALAGVVLAVRRHGSGDRLLLSLLVPYFVVVGASPSTFPRHLLVLVPGLVLLAARAATAPRSPALRAAAVGVAVVYSAALTVTDVARLGWTQQDDVARFVRVRSAGAVAVAFPSYGPYLRLGEALKRAGLREDGRAPGRWFDPPAPYFVLPEWYATAIRRDRANPLMVRDLDALESGASGYRPLYRVPTPWYLQRPLDRCLDPGLVVDVWQGAIGFTVYGRDGG
jgi:hypothetical protein